jgi:hypothetical protein
MNLSVAIKLIKSLIAYVSEKRDCSEEYESRAKENSHIDDYQNAYKRVRQCSSTIAFLDGGRNTDEVLLGRRKFKAATYIPIIDSLVNNLEKRSKEYEDIFEKLVFLESLHVLDQREITKQSEKLANFYNKDLSSDELTSECLHFKSYIKFDMKLLMESKNVEDAVKAEECINIHKIYIYMYNENISSIFPNVEIATRIFLFMMATNASGERSFSNLNLLKMN